MSDSHHIEQLQTRHNNVEQLDYLYFWGHQPSKQGMTASCFSQWYEAPFVVNGDTYPTAEHFMMAEKAALFGDQTTRNLVLQASTASEAKAFGRLVRGFDEAIWLQHRFSIVVRANVAKFSQNMEMKHFLQQTGSQVLVEASPVDKIWGIGLAQDNPKVNNPNHWQGLNLLGFALMQVRNELSK